MKEFVDAIYNYGWLAVKGVFFFAMDAWLIIAILDFFFIKIKRDGKNVFVKGKRK